MSRIENKIENRAIRKTLNIEEEEVVQQLFLLVLAPKALQDAPKNAPKVAVQQLGVLG